MGRCQILLDYFLTPKIPFFAPLATRNFDDGLGWNLDLLLRLWIKARARLPLLLYEFAKTGQDKFAVLFNLFVGDVAERIQEYSSRSFVGLGGFGKCAFEALSWSSVALFMPETGDPRHPSSF